ncbi:hypothetical protein BDA99DRAFT_540847 [Phascolomyces articulosus]|uniref:Uncharacterized protein n=1 Tax=Phascolomyces articulosus TaxID=60185 RepID=A0AAD5K2U4_9FUNG|nr:hypothetical protein BDA99DRAFT_540847 [Phascolomyces articulosus]
MEVSSESELSLVIIRFVVGELGFRSVSDFLFDMKENKLHSLSREIIILFTTGIRNTVSLNCACWLIDSYSHFDNWNTVPMMERVVEFFSAAKFHIIILLENLFVKYQTASVQSNNIGLAHLDTAIKVTTQRSFDIPTGRRLIVTIGLSSSGELLGNI